MQNILTKQLTLSREFFDRFRFFPQFLSGSTLKLIAVITMAIDHFAAAVLYYMLMYHLFPFDLEFDTVYDIYLKLRIIGRQAFPIYCFLLVEGLFHTRNRARYLITMLLFSLLSELPFDLAVTIEAYPDTLEIPLILSENAPILMSHQNVFWTLSVGLAAIWGIEGLRKRFGTCLLTLICAVPIGAGAAFLAEKTHMDYGGIGIAVILCLYLLQVIRPAAVAAGYGCIQTLYLEVWTLPAFILMLFYNGKRGFLGRRAGAKYFFYVFYPAHLLLYAVLRALWLRRLY